MFKYSIIAEGYADLAVLTNILKAKGIDSSEIHYIRPDLRADNTDKSLMTPSQFGGNSLVKKECEDIGNNINISVDIFLNKGGEFIIIQLDSFEKKDYGVNEIIVKTGNKNYSIEVIDLIKAKINEWLQNKHLAIIKYAIAVEEIDAWIIPLFENKNSSLSNNPKRKLNTLISSNKTLYKKANACNTEFEKYYFLSNKLSKTKDLNTAMRLNQSLEIFVNSL